ncbi:hypothetical protein ACUN0C_15225 [Faunimonas sp. B44]|uniref:hypothetical protein n=1 Tax=Faunimonas sp. B44 TaxID=3461493 RepID=UPI00404446A1
MTKAPDVIAARVRADELVAFFRDTPIEFFGIEVRLLAKSDNRRLAVTVMKRLAISDEAQMGELVDYARQGWGLAATAMRELIAEHAERGKPLPSPLLVLSVDLAARRIPAGIRGQSKADLFLRDVAVSIMVEKLIEEFGLKATARGGNTATGLGIRIS